MYKKITFLILVFTLLLFSTMTYAEEQLNAAKQLNVLGLFNGVGKTNTGEPIFDLERQPNRQEAITLLVKLLGKENEAKSKIWKHPFIDVDSWADPYVGYAYNNGLTSGVGNNRFGSKDLVTANQYLTFLLKALGYSSETDFKWNEATKFSDSLSITNGEYGNSSHFTRGDIVVLSARGLKVDMKGYKRSLIENLYFSNAISLESIIKAGLKAQITVEAISEHLEQYTWGNTRKDLRYDFTEFIWREVGKPYLTEYNGKLYYISSGFVKDIFGEYYVELDYVSTLLQYAYGDVYVIEQNNPFVGGLLSTKNVSYFKNSQVGPSLTQTYFVITYYNKTFTKSYEVIPVNYEQRDLREPVGNYKVSNDGYQPVIKLTDLEAAFGDFHVEITTSPTQDYYIVKFTNP